MSYTNEAKEALTKIGIKEEFKLMYLGWELDCRAWLLNDGRLVFTNHGSHYFGNVSELEFKIQEAKEYLENLTEVRNLI